MTLVAYLRRPAFAVTLAVLCGSLFGQSPRAAYGSEAAGYYRIAGVLVNGSTGEPIRRGVVQALNDAGRVVASSTTDDDGSFALDHLTAAKYQLAASKHGFRVQSYDEHDEFASSIVTGPNLDTTHINFKLTPNAVLYGTVTDDDGDPVENARVMLFKRPKFPGAGERITQVNAATTDDTGAYEFGDIGPGEYLMAVAAEPWYAVHSSTTARNNALDVAFPVTYFDSTTDEQAATPVELAGGMHQEANISMHAVPALHISVPAQRRSEENTGVGAELQQIVFGSMVGVTGNYNYTSNPGNLTMDGVTPGHYQLVMHGDPDRVVDLALSSNQQIDPGSASSAGAVAGKVRMAGGSPMAEELTVSLERTDDGPGQNQLAAEAHQGRFRLDSVPPGEYAVSVIAGDKSMPVIAIATGEMKKAGNLITIRDRTPELIVTVGEGEVRVEGFAEKDGQGFAGAMMVLLPKNTALWKSLTRRDQSDSDGSFAFREVAPGEYTAIAVEQGWALNWTSPAAMARFLPRGTNVTVTGNAGKLVRLSSAVMVQQR